METPSCGALCNEPPAQSVCTSAGPRSFSWHTRRLLRAERGEGRPAGPAERRGSSQGGCGSAAGQASAGRRERVRAEHQHVNCLPQAARKAQRGREFSKRRNRPTRGGRRAAPREAEGRRGSPAAGRAGTAGGERRGPKAHSTAPGPAALPSARQTAAPHTHTHPPLPTSRRSPPSSGAHRPSLAALRPHRPAGRPAEAPRSVWEQQTGRAAALRAARPRSWAAASGWERRCAVWLCR